jgi:hypothetical protein
LPTFGNPTIPHLNPMSSSTFSHRHGRAQPSEGRRRFRSPMPGHPRLAPAMLKKGVDARHRAGHDENEAPS